MTAMLSLSLHQIEMIPWYSFGAFWLLAAFRVKPTKSIEPAAARIFTAVLLATAFYLMFSRESPFVWLNRRFIPANSAFPEVGTALTYVGVAIAIWARVALGSNWSARVMVKEGHELVRSGPYAYVRHPIYTGLLLAITGTTLIIGEWRGVIAIIIVTVAHSLKAKREEAAMNAEFGETYQQYRKTTGFLFPGL
jgi:protein-S-isoprenylcysteine O-methyltransferase Ste14